MKLISSLSAVVLMAGSLTVQAATVTGSVTNKTTNKPDVGDPVVLISFTKGMQETARTKTDAHGRFSLDVPDNNVHLIRVDHQKAAYFEPLPPGTKHVDVTVYDVGEKVAGVATEADVMRIEAGPQGLRVIQNYFVKNASKPPRTQFGLKAFEVYLPPGAKIEASAAAGPSGMPVSSSPMQQKDTPGHYAFTFPLRPGETRFQLTYSLPYKGSFKFTPRVALPTENLAVMLPKSMNFDGSSFEQADIEQNANTYLVKNVDPSQALEFTVSGTGVLPTQPQQASSADQSSSAESNPAVTDTRPGGGLGDPIDTPDPLQKYKGWILSGLGLLLVIAAGFFLRARPREAVAGGAPAPAPSPLAPTPARNSDSLLDSLKNELFVLETERLEGKLSEAEYAEQKAALEQVLRRALDRQQTGNRQ